MLFQVNLQIVDWFHLQLMNLHRNCFPGSYSQAAQAPVTAPKDWYIQAKDHSKSRWVTHTITWAIVWTPPWNLPFTIITLISINRPTPQYFLLEDGVGIGMVVSSVVPALRLLSSDLILLALSKVGWIWQWMVSWIPAVRWANLKYLGVVMLVVRSSSCKLAKTFDS